MDEIWPMRMRHRRFEMRVGDEGLDVRLCDDRSVRSLDVCIFLQCVERQPNECRRGVEGGECDGVGGVDVRVVDSGSEAVEGGMSLHGGCGRCGGKVHRLRSTRDRDGDCEERHEEESIERTARAPSAAREAAAHGEGEERGDEHDA